MHAALTDRVCGFPGFPSHKVRVNEISSIFRRFSEATARNASKPGAFVLAALVVIVWAATGPVFHFGDTWQLVINTGTTIITLLMVFLIQSSQNRHTGSLQIKLDELIRSSHANHALINRDELGEDAIERVRGHYRAMAKTKGTELVKLEIVLREIREACAGQEAAAEEVVAEVKAAVVAADAAAVSAVR